MTKITSRVSGAKGNTQNPRGFSKRSSSVVTSGGIFQCFAIDGDDVNLHRRSTFSSARKAEVRGIRKKGACLRCKLLKRACSGEDPCKTCILAANAAVGSRALMWMECIRPSFQALNVFNKYRITPGQNRVPAILNDLLHQDVSLDFHIPFAQNVNAASSFLATWLSDDSSAPTFSVVGVFSCSTNTSVLRKSLNSGLVKDLRLFVHLTTHIYTGIVGRYQSYTEDEVRCVRDYVGRRLILALDPLLRPSELEASHDKLSKLKSIFLLLLGITVGMRYTYLDTSETGYGRTNDNEGANRDALLRLLCHYLDLVYIGKVTSLLGPSSDEKVLVETSKSAWDKPAAFTWDPSAGLESRYRVQQLPTDWMISSKEGESTSGIDMEPSESAACDGSVLNTDIAKCVYCSTMWEELNQHGLCRLCQTICGESFGNHGHVLEDASAAIALTAPTMGDDLASAWLPSSHMDFSLPTTAEHAPTPNLQTSTLYTPEFLISPSGISECGGPLSTSSSSIPYPHQAVDIGCEVAFSVPPSDAQVLSTSYRWVVKAPINPSGENGFSTSGRSSDASLPPFTVPSTTNHLYRRRSKCVGTRLNNSGRGWDRLLV